MKASVTSRWAWLDLTCLLYYYYYYISPQKRLSTDLGYQRLGLLAFVMWLTSNQQKNFEAAAIFSGFKATSRFPK